MSESLSVMEREVEAARSKLANDLASLRSPETAADFTRALKQDAKSALQSTMHSVLEDVKARAAANPVAALAVGAGIAWRVIRHPPIATALIGAGLVSLFRTQPTPRSNGAEYLSLAKSRLKQQASQAVDYATEQAAHIGNSVSEGTGELASAVKVRAREWTTEAASSGKRIASDLQERAASVSDQASEALSEMQRRVTAAAHPYADSAEETISDPQQRDRLLLSAAGIAVIAALGMTLQRRLSEADG